MSDELGDPSEDPSAVWVWSLPAWHVSFVVLLSLFAGLVFLVAPATTAAECTGLLVVLGIGYVVFGVRAAHQRGSLDRWCYLGLAAVICVLATWLVPSASALLFLLFPQCWLLASRERDGVIATALLTFAVAIGPALGGATSVDDWRSAAPSLVIGAAFSLALGLFMLRLIDQSRERAVLLHRLTLAQDELAVANHAAGVVAERQRLAAEIHDTLAQGFTSIAMQAEAVLAGPVAGAETDRLQLIARTARDNLAEARALVAAFSPAPLEDTSLAEAVRRVAGRFQDETGIDVDVTVAGSLDALPRSHQVVVLRAVQEALANVRKHARARRVLLVLSAAAGVVTLEVDDDGVGMVGRTTAGFGIANMTARVHEVGGEIEVASPAVGGTRLRIVIPQPQRTTEPARDG